jgi:hypothetical protein
MKYATYSDDRIITGFYGIEPQDEQYVEITDDEWQILLNGQSAGKVMTIGDDGKPALVDQPPPSPDEILAMNTAQRTTLVSEAAMVIEALQDVVDYGTPTDAQTAALTTWRKYRAALMAVDLTANPAAWPDKPAQP